MLRNRLSKNLFRWFCVLYGSLLRSSLRNNLLKKQIIGTLDLSKTNSLSELAKKLEDKQIDVSGGADTLINYAPFFEKRVIAENGKYDIIAASLKELGFADGATYKQVCRRLISLDSILLPLPSGPYVCLDCSELPEVMVLAMNPFLLTYQRQTYKISQVKGQITIETVLANPHTDLDAETIIGFVRPLALS